MQAHRLIPHPAFSPASVSVVEVRIGLNDPDWLQLRWRIEGSGDLVLPGITGKNRADGLWQTTCFELFLRPDGGNSYFEWNLSPSRQWNAYSFSSHREGMVPLDIARAPDCVMRRGSKFAIFDAAIPRTQLPDRACEMGVSAVIEETGGTKSYWALAHADSEAPDFHHPACFAASLPAPRNP